MPGIATFLCNLKGQRNPSVAIFEATVDSLNETVERVTTTINKSLLGRISKAVLISPMGTSSILIDGSEWTKDVHKPLKSNAITSTHFWGEGTAGRWTLSLNGRFHNVKDDSVSLTFTGIFVTPKEDKEEENTRDSDFMFISIALTLAVLLLVHAVIWRDYLYANRN
ncbi:hypothetical protein MAR_007394 [Mya arenaria]|uniref:P/Homo B domain-containing protein n=1 Tax=Mya arenaria TaxID=6604 RepID=A0ABY7DCB1_MYAAR|nr:hypothetical protein MAR_007394 [Mya arenaria]